MSNQVSLARDMLKLTVLTFRPLTLLGRQGCGHFACLKFILRYLSQKRFPSCTDLDYKYSHSHGMLAHMFRGLHNLTLKYGLARTHSLSDIASVGSSFCFAALTLEL